LPHYDRDDAYTAKKFKSNFVLSDAIGNPAIPITALEITYQKMLKDQKDDPENRIPHRFGPFIKSAEFKELLEAMLEYLRELFRLENKQQVLEQEARQRGLPIPQVLPSEKKKLSEKARKMADKYAWIVFNFKSVGLQEHVQKKSSFMEFKSAIISNQKHDKIFYETMLLFASKVL